MSRRVPAAFVTGLLLIVTGAAPGHAYDPVTWSTFDGGGVDGVTAGPWTLGGTIGQPDAGTLSGGGFTLRGGFRHGGATPVVGVGGIAPPAIAFRFFRATPNPVRAESRVAFDLPSATLVRLSIHDVAGRAVRVEELGFLPAGHQERTWHAVDDGGRPLGNGVYFLRLEAGRERAAQKVLVLR